MNGRINIKRILQFLVSLTIVLDCETIWKWVDGRGWYNLIITSLLIFSLLLLILMEKKKANSHLALLLFLIGLSAINISKGIYGIIPLCLIILFMSYYFENPNNLKKTFDYICRIMLPISVISLFFFIFVNVLNIIPPTGKVVVYVNNIPKICNSFFNLHYTVQQEAAFGLKIFRNTSIFYEGPKYSLILSFCLMYNLFIKKRPNMKESTIFTITIATTLSLTGIALTLTIWLMYILFKRGNNRKNIIKRTIFLLLIIIALPKIIGLANNIMTIKSSTASYSTRIDNYAAGYKAWMDNPFFGNGYLNMEGIKSYYSSFRSNDIGYSNSIFRILAQGGVYMFSLYLLHIIRGLAASISDKDLFKFFYIALFVYLFITTSFPYNFIAFLAIFSISNIHFSSKSLSERKGKETSNSEQIAPIRFNK